MNGGPGRVQSWLLGTSCSPAAARLAPALLPGLISALAWALLLHSEAKGRRARLSCAPGTQSWGWRSAGGTEGGSPQVQDARGLWVLHPKRLRKDALPFPCEPLAARPSVPRTALSLHRWGSLSGLTVAAGDTALLQPWPGLSWSHSPHHWPPCLSVRRFHFNVLQKGLLLWLARSATSQTEVHSVQRGRRLFVPMFSRVISFPIIPMVTLLGPPHLNLSPGMLDQP